MSDERMPTMEFADLLANWDGLLYEHNINTLKELLYCAKRLQIDIERQIMQEEKYQ